MVRKIILSSLFYSAFTYCTVAQEKGTMDIGITVGTGTTNEIINTTSDILGTAFTGGSVSYENTRATPSITAYYKYAIKNKWMLFADLSFQSIYEDIYINNSKTGDAYNRYLTFGIGTEYHYVSTQWVQLYSGGSIAITNQYVSATGSSDINSNNFNFQINGFGCRVGKALAGTVELGFGYRGIINAGVSYQF